MRKMLRKTLKTYAGFDVGNNGRKTCRSRPDDGIVGVFAGEGGHRLRKAFLRWNRQILGIKIPFNGKLAVGQTAIGS